MLGSGPGRYNLVCTFLTDTIKASLRSLKNAHQRGRAAVQPSERRFEHIAGQIPRILNRASRVEQRIEIAGNNDRGAICREQSCDLARLAGIHHDDEVGVANDGLREWTRPVPREVESAFRAQGNGNRRNWAVATYEARGCYRQIGKGALKHCLEVRASTEVGVAYDEDSPRTSPAR